MKITRARSAVTESAPESKPHEVRAVHEADTALAAGDFAANAAGIADNTAPAPTTLEILGAR